MLGKTTIRNPFLFWRSEASPDTAPARGDPPPGPFAVTRSEVRITRRNTTVVIWYALVPAVPGALYPDGVMPGETAISASQAEHSTSLNRRAAKLADERGQEGKSSCT